MAGAKPPVSEVLEHQSPARISAASDAASTAARKQADRSPVLMDNITAPAPVAVTQNQPIESQVSNSSGSSSIKQDESELVTPHDQIVATPAPLASTANAEQNETDSGAGNDSMREVVVTGSRIADRNQSSNSRLTAKEQSTRYAGDRYEPDESVISSATADAESEAPTKAPFPYECDLENMQIGEDEIESAVVDARNVQPPRNVVTWPAYISLLANQNDYVEACAQLAAFERMYPDFIHIEPLPVRISK